MVESMKESSSPSASRKKSGNKIRDAWPAGFTTELVLHNLSAELDDGLVFKNFIIFFKTFLLSTFLHYYFISIYFFQSFEYQRLQKN